MPSVPPEQEVTAEVKTTAIIGENEPIVHCGGSPTAELKAMSVGMELKVEKMCFYLETSGKPYATGKAQRLRECCDEAAKLVWSLDKGPRSKKRKRPEEQVESPPTGPDYVAITVATMARIGGEDASGSPVSDIHSESEKADSVVETVVDESVNDTDDPSDDDGQPVKKKQRSQHKHMNAKQQAAALAALEAKIQEISKAPEIKQTPGPIPRLIWLPPSPPKDDDAGRSQVQTQEMITAKYSSEVQSSAARESPRPSTDEPNTAATISMDSTPLQAQDVYIVSRLALSAQYLSHTMGSESAVVQDIQAFGIEFCGEKCWNERTEHYAASEWEESNEEMLAWAKATLIGLVAIVDEFDAEAANEIDRLASVI
ncbi:hypothetical protein LTR62_002285 [Meristemomyces frigidus]|uniref:Uncharacterized protein n=1 Tax=Meristemomyces frigidus TaxID=1508187 RepID=A0AAN7YQB0_9PEZI|nr:hypothetical protein LTR62_002285 [Meristemomyces frigidus]